MSDSFFVVSFFLFAIVMFLVIAYFIIKTILELFEENKDKIKNITQRILRYLAGEGNRQRRKIIKDKFVSMKHGAEIVFNEISILERRDFKNRYEIEYRRVLEIQTYF